MTQAQFITTGTDQDLEIAALKCALRIALNGMKPKRRRQALAVIRNSLAPRQPRWATLGQNVVPIRGPRAGPEQIEAARTLARALAAQQRVADYVEDF